MQLLNADFGSCTFAECSKLPVSNQNGTLSKLSLICLAQVIFLLLTCQFFVVVVLELVWHSFHFDLFFLLDWQFCLVLGKATSVKFGPDAKYIAVGSMDRNLRIFGLPGNDVEMESWSEGFEVVPSLRWTDLQKLQMLFHNWLLAIFGR